MQKKPIKLSYKSHEKIILYFIVFIFVALFLLGLIYIYAPAENREAAKQVFETFRHISYAVMFYFVGDKALKTIISSVRS